MMTPHIVYTVSSGSLRNVLLGAGIAYAIEKEQYTHIPIVFVFPSVYAGYQLYKNKVWSAFN
jgi:hypothetical protein